MKGGHEEFHHLVWRNLGEPGSEPVIWGRQNQPKAPEFDAESALGSELNEPADDADHGPVHEVAVRLERARHGLGKGRLAAAGASSPRGPQSLCSDGSADHYEAGQPKR